MYNKTVIDVVLDAKDEFVSICCERWLELFSTILFMVTIPWGRKIWLNVLNLAMFIKGTICIIIPARIASQFIAEGELTSTHVELLRTAGLLMVMWSLSYWLVSKSTDSTVVTSFLWAMAIILTCQLICFGYVLTHAVARKKSVTLQPKVMTAGFYGTMLFTLGTYFYAMKSNDWAGYAEMSSRANVHMRINFVILMVTGVVTFAVPQWLLSLQMKIDSVDSFHAFLGRVCSSILIGMALLVGRAANFLRGSDKQAIVLTHLVYFLIALSTGWYARRNDIAALPWTLVLLFAVTDISSLINTMGALDFDIGVLNVVTTRIRQAILDAKIMYMDTKNMIKLRRY